ncbi:MAG: M28 family peptidase [Deltaproteobacteria bacterium]|nr:M28 family peptidase [Deltaproteobacteria bacterium]MBW2072623.1 M28 family peptidase [Deltaproteobacteria bacterium]
MLKGTAIHATIEEICSLGPRWMGTPGALDARDFVADQFRKAGLIVELQSFSYLSYTPEHAVFLVNGQEVPCEPIALSLSTKTPLEAPLVFGGKCTAREIEALQHAGVKLANAIVISENLRSFVAYPLAADAGAAGFVSMTNLPGNTIRCGCARLDRRAGTIPAVAIGGDDGRRLVQELGSRPSLTGKLEVRGRIESKEGHNVVGWRKGRSPTKILITAHYDSFWNGVHAMDNAAGMATVIELSRILDETHGHTLEFVVFGGEELGFWGSASYVEAHHSNLENIGAVVNLDTFGSNLSQLEIGVTADLVDFCETIVREKTILVDCWNVPPRAASDQHPFVERGISAIWLANCGADQRYHTPLDVPSQMSAHKLEQVASLARLFIENIGRAFS